MSLENKVIFISGTPCTGKTTLATELAKRLEHDGFNCKFIKINDFAISNNFVDGEDPDKFYKVINIEKLDTALNEELNTFFDDKVTFDDETNDSKEDNELNNSVNDFNNEKIAIVEGHLSHFCHGADKMIVLRLNPTILKERLDGRNYTESKVHENCEAEALAVCSVEAYELYGEDTNEIDCSEKSIEELIAICLDIIQNNQDYPVGYIDFMEWILSNS